MAQHFLLDDTIRAQRRPRPDTAAADEISGSPSRLVLMGAVGVFVLAGFFFLATIHAIVTLDAQGIQIERDRATVAVGVMTEGGVALDSVLATKLGHDYVLNGTRLAQPDSLSPNEVFVALPDTALVLAWTPRKFATETFAVVAPYRFAAAALVLAGLAFVLHRLYRLARNLERRRQAARDLAGRDPLTGLLNRRGFAEALDRSFAEGNGDVALLYLDLDDFKRVNDSHGHAVGDKLLECVAQRLANAIGPHDAVARLGGDEFTILRHGGGTERQLAQFAHMIHTRITGPYGLGNLEVSIGLSIGIASRSMHCRTPADLVANADAALYRAKAIENAPYAFAEAEQDFSEAA
jgi:diguanylate cyclase (GGDEF)-like protein